MRLSRFIGVAGPTLAFVAACRGTPGVDTLAEERVAANEAALAMEKQAVDVVDFIHEGCADVMANKEARFRTDTERRPDGEDQTYYAAMGPNDEICIYTKTVKDDKNDPDAIQVDVDSFKYSDPMKNQAEFFFDDSSVSRGYFFTTGENARTAQNVRMRILWNRENPCEFRSGKGGKASPSLFPDKSLCTNLRKKVGEVSIDVQVDLQAGVRNTPSTSL